MDALIKQVLAYEMDHLYAKAYVRAAQARDRREIAEIWPKRSPRDGREKTERRPR